MVHRPGVEPVTSRSRVQLPAGALCSVYMSVMDKDAVLNVFLRTLLLYAGESPGERTGEGR